MASYRDFIKAFHNVGLDSQSKVIVHAWLPSMDVGTAGAETLIGALLATIEIVITPTFTKKAMIVPPFGPADNALQYGTSEVHETIGEYFHPDLPSDEELGGFAEGIRCHPKAQRSNHPLLSFAGINAEQALSSQTLEAPWAPIKWLADADGDVVLLGADHTKNITIHYAERLAKRKQFIRWALADSKVIEVPHWPGCSRGFQAIVPRLSDVVREEVIGNSKVQAIPLRDLINVAAGWIREAPEALLCHETGCEYCAAVRASHRVSSSA
jgi:aminoglycoside 3-N-acetyltransferase